MRGDWIKGKRGVVTFNLSQTDMSLKPICEEAVRKARTLFSDDHLNYYFESFDSNIHSQDMSPGWTSNGTIHMIVTTQPRAGWFATILNNKEAIEFVLLHEVAHNYNLPNDTLAFAVGNANLDSEGVSSRGVGEFVDVINNIGMITHPDFRRVYGMDGREFLKRGFLATYQVDLSQHQSGKFMEYHSSFYKNGKFPNDRIGNLLSWFVSKRGTQMPLIIQDFYKKWTELALAWSGNSYPQTFSIPSGDVDLWDDLWPRLNQAVAEYKPDQRSDDEWKAIMYHTLSAGASGASTHSAPLDLTTRMNRLFYETFTVDILEYLVAELYKKPRGGRAKEYGKVGLSVDDKKPDYSRSIETYGNLFFETKYGYHKEKAKHVRGKPFQGTSGDVVLVATIDRDMSYLRQRIVYAMTYAFLQDAAQRKDKITLFLSPFKYRQWVELWGTPPPDMWNNRKVTIRFYKRDGKPFIHSRAFNRQNTPDLIFNPCRVGKFPNSYISNRSYDSALSVMKPFWSVSETAAVWIPFISSTEYDAVEDFLLMLPLKKNNTTSTIIDYTIPTLTTKHIWNKLNHVKRGRIIILFPFYEDISTKYALMRIWKQIEDLARNNDIFWFDWGDGTGGLFHFARGCASSSRTPNRDCRKDAWGKDTDEPLLVSHGKPLLKYIYINDIKNFSQIALKELKKYERA